MLYHKMGNFGEEKLRRISIDKINFGKLVDILVEKLIIVLIV